MGMTINLNGNEMMPQIETQGLGQAPIEPVECFFSFTGILEKPGAMEPFSKNLRIILKSHNGQHYLEAPPQCLLGQVNSKLGTCKAEQKGGQYHQQ